MTKRETPEDIRHWFQNAIQGEAPTRTGTQVPAVYTNKHDVIERLEGLFRGEGIRAATLRASVPAHKRKAWYREQLRRGIDVAICYSKIVETGLDLLDFPTILFP